MPVEAEGGLSLVAIRGVEAAPAATVVELSVTAPDVYFAGGVLVHNY